MVKKTRQERERELRTMSSENLTKLVPEGTHVQIPDKWWALSVNGLIEKIREAFVQVILGMEYPDQTLEAGKVKRQVRWEQLYRTPVAELLKLARKLGITDVVIPRRMTLDEFETSSGSTCEQDKLLIEAILDVEGSQSN